MRWHVRTPDRGAHRPTDDLSDLISQRAPGWKLEHWSNSEPRSRSQELRGKVVLVHWFMAPSGPFCSANAPALNRFDEEYRGRGLVVVGVCHHKDPEPLDVETVRGPQTSQFRFPTAVDPDWADLEALVARRATSDRGRTPAYSSIDAV